MWLEVLGSGLIFVEHLFGDGVSGLGEFWQHHLYEIQASELGLFDPG